MDNFSFCTPTQVHFGRGSLDHLYDEVTAVGKKVLLVYGGNSIKRSGLYDKVKDILSDCEIYEQGGVEPKSTCDLGARWCAAVQGARH